jgi:hypothetical protein
MNELVRQAIIRDEFIQRRNNITLSFDNADWFVNYNIPDDTTALVICGADTIGVMFIVLKGNHIDEFKKVIEEYKDFNPGVNGCLGECIRWAVMQNDIIPERCTIGGLYSKMTITKKNLI